MKKSFKNRFVGRSQELDYLNNLHLLKQASLVVINGRRRIGKSRLINEFAKGSQFLEFSGLAPNEKMNASDQRSEFANSIAKYFGLPKFISDNWTDLFEVLAKQTAEGEVVILLDEISWMAHKSPVFLSQLKSVWDRMFSQNPGLILVLCGSISSWIEKNILSSTGFLGRPSLHIHLKQLPIQQCSEFWGLKANHLSAFEKLKFLALTGGVPRYLELMDPSKSAEENIRHLCYLPVGPLFREFQHIFSDIYAKRSNTYQLLVTALADQPSLLREEISELTGLHDNGDLTEYLNDLILGGFIQRDFTWKLGAKKSSSLSRYRLKDNYTRFYLRYIRPNIVQIEKGYYATRSLSTLPAWDSIMGLQFECLVLNNHKRIIELLKIPYEDILFDNPYFQRKTQRQKSCQVDYLIHTRFNTIYVCEIKFKCEPIGLQIVDEVEEKIRRLKVPKNCSVRPVLIHVNGVTGDNRLHEYFSSIIDFSDFLKNEQLEELE